MPMVQSRREFLATASVTAAAGVLVPRGALADEGPPEVTTIRLRKSRPFASLPDISRENCCVRRASPMSGT